MAYHNDAAAELKAKTARSVQIIKSGVLACLRCGGSGIYHIYGVCFRCGGSGVDPTQPRFPDKSKRLQQQREWAAHFTDQGDPIACGVTERAS
jgi:hypothetical protein